MTQVVKGVKACLKPPVPGQALIHAVLVAAPVRSLEVPTRTMLSTNWHQQSTRGPRTMHLYAKHA
jgi:hypothetical protein